MSGRILRKKSYKVEKCNKLRNPTYTIRQEKMYSIQFGWSDTPLYEASLILIRRRIHPFRFGNRCNQSEQETGLDINGQMQPYPKCGPKSLKKSREFWNKAHDIQDAPVVSKIQECMFLDQSTSRQKPMALCSTKKKHITPAWKRVGRTSPPSSCLLAFRTCGTTDTGFLTCPQPQQPS